VRASSAYFIKTLPVDRHCLDIVLEWLHPPRPTGKERRLFVSRKETDGRTPTNLEEIRRLLDNYGFDEVFPEELCLEEQMRLFVDARHVIGIHGAGLTNLLFRRENPLALLELFPPEIFPPFKAAPHYYWLCAKYGYKYDAMRGDMTGGNARKYFSGSRAAPFRLELGQLEARVKSLLQY
jgi:hypothetical protein